MNQERKMSIYRSKRTKIRPHNSIRRKRHVDRQIGHQNSFRSLQILRIGNENHSTILVVSDTYTKKININIYF